MKEFLLTSTIPYWIVFAFMTSAGILEIVNIRKGEITKNAAILCSTLAIAGTLLGIAVYSIAGGNCVWWCTSSDYGFFSKLLRAIPLFVFLAVQLSQVFVYKRLMALYWDRELSVKTLFVVMTATVPTALVIYVILGIFGVKQNTTNMVFYIITITSVIAGVGLTMTKNIKSAGTGNGLLFTGVTFIMITGGVFSLILMLKVIIVLIVQVLACAVPFIAALFLLKSNIIGKAGASSQNRQVFYDDDGHMHYNSTSRNMANNEISQRKSQENQ